MLTELHKLRTELSSYLQNGFDFYLKKVRLTWYSQDDKVGKVLAQHYKRRAAQSKIQYLLDSRCHRLTNPKDIANCFGTFYSKLYNIHLSPTEPKPSQSSIHDFLSLLHLPSLTHMQLEALVQPFSHQELLAAIGALPLHKAPGPDGFSNDYKTYT